MTKFKKIVSGALTLAFSATVMFSSIPSAFALENWSTIRTDFSKVMLAPGADESQLNFAWYSTEDSVPVVQIVKDEEEFADAGLFTGTISTAYRNAETGTQYFSNKVTATGLEPNTSYKYRYKTGDGAWSETYSYNTQSSENGFGFIAVGDVQIGVGNGGSEQDTERWENTLSLAIEKMPDASFIMSMGDQVDGNKEEDQYAGFMYPELLRSMPISTLAGNHDCDVPNLTWHFNNPNQTKYGETNAGGDYYYSYGPGLFIVLNTNNYNVAEHAETIKEAVASNPDAKWRIVTIHQDIYGSGLDHSDTDGMILRTQLTPIFDQYDVDVVLQGHDHTYSRSKMLYGDVQQHDNYEFQLNETGDDYDWEHAFDKTASKKIALYPEDSDAQAQADLEAFHKDNACYTIEDTEGNQVVNPKGILYITTNSASGSKYYELAKTQQDYIEKRSQNWLPSYSVVDVKGDSIFCYLDDKLDFSCKRQKGGNMEGVYASTTIDDATHTMYVKVVNVGDGHADGTINLKNCRVANKAVGNINHDVPAKADVSLTRLSSASGDDENTIDNPKHIFPQEGNVRAEGPSTVKFDVPAYSVNIIKIGLAE